MVKITYTGRTSAFTYGGISRADADGAVLAHLLRFRYEVPKEGRRTLGDARPAQREVPLTGVSAVWVDDADPTKTEPLVVPTKLPPAARS